ncbi:MAG: hypothetical protein IPO10_14285 [Flavobacteriales bacterium]|nr:hypothetical protein [Flavobacteriales bacterium]
MQLLTVRIFHGTVRHAGDYVVEYGPVGFTPGSGIGAGAGGTVWTGTAVPASPISLTGLAGLTAYEVVVRERCGPGEFSSNTAKSTFVTLCGGTTCDYLFRLGDIYGDGWDGSEWQVKQNGIVIATLGPQIVGCGDGGTGYVDVPVTICEGATVTLEWTTLGSFTNEKALQFYNPFGVLLYDHRGTASYPGNCDDVNWTSANSAGTTGLKFTTTANCAPPSCSATAVPTSEDCIAGTYDILITEIDITGNATIQYTLNGVAQADIPFVAPSTLITGIDVEQAANITIVTDDGCTNEIGNVQSACVVELDCAATSPLPFSHCYSNGDTRKWYFYTPEAGGKVDLKFLNGSIRSWRQRDLLERSSLDIPQIGSYSGDMSNLTFTGQTNQYLGVSITTNGSGSCEDGLAGTAWNFTVRCSGCIEPTGLVLVSPDDGSSVDCIAGTFGASVYVGSFGQWYRTECWVSTCDYDHNFMDRWRCCTANIVLTQTSDESGLLTSLVHGRCVEIDVTLLHGNGETVCNNPIGSDLTIPLVRAHHQMMIVRMRSPLLLEHRVHALQVELRGIRSVHP